MLLALDSLNKWDRWVAALLIPLFGEERSLGQSCWGILVSRKQGVPSPLPLGWPATWGGPKRRCLPVASTAHEGLRHSRVACGQRTITPLSDFFFFSHFSSKRWVALLALQHSWRYCVEKPSLMAVFSLFILGCFLHWKIPSFNTGIICHHCWNHRVYLIGLQAWEIARENGRGRAFPCIKRGFNKVSEPKNP